MKKLIFVHGMFLNPTSWQKWVGFFQHKGYECLAPPWPMHEGDPRHLRANMPPQLGELRLEQIVNHLRPMVAELDSPIMIGHSVGGLITQIFLQEGMLSCGVAIDSVAPNAMIDLDWGFLKNSATIANPLKGDEPVLMDAKTFHAAFANTLSEGAATAAFEEFATHDSRNVLRDCMGSAGRLDVEAPHNPLLLIGGEKDEIIPAHLTEKNARAYTDTGSQTSCRIFDGRSHFICGEPGWEEVATYVADWLAARGNQPRL